MDEIIRMMTGDGMVKAVAVTGKDMVERARQIHKTLPVATAALGRTLMAASMMGDMLKEKDGSVTLQIKGGGPLGAITAVSDSRGNPRGYLQNGQVDIPRKYQGKLDVGTAVGSSGSLTVMKDMGLKEPYIGSVQLVSGEIAEDITAYFVESEQVPTACALGVLVDKDQSVAAAGGYLVQLLPGADESVIQRLEESIARLGPVTDALHGGADAVQLLGRVLEGQEPELLERRPVAYKCYCSRERVSRAIISMGKEEMQNLIEEQGGAELTCQFCDKVYRFTKEDLQELLEEATR
ncbi:Hsp33 family molecular chaperone HslO [Intestinimonas massiliensis (ex Afouda et al. 2020)]|uniref:33 kDa chaperonin n=1 Tax=Intestinimonas massiliensis (ex Afouda et al. 2020) TaxID=1673721 RepID=A0ABS9MCE0_9FIRM|nr:Hsp33 family molecular chaperone HslO [Intestinimonas massiliensis (ex Afouda et al. 2020)]MCG4528484.1 Hsp33 family molecular chaperone HslO [Intestinimonas massiliensis (ex Afouda et al. 2020)]MCQ4807424.1 Hsp33 family molecular chaperone HslO [Intestinimonas massiliensis (ex Afouda et al. 2020)]